MVDHKHGLDNSVKIMPKPYFMFLHSILLVCIYDNNQIKFEFVENQCNLYRWTDISCFLSHIVQTGRKMSLTRSDTLVPLEEKKDNF